jgi:hypothetical protein
MRGDKHPKPSEFWLSTYSMSFAEIIDKSNCNRLFVEYQYVNSNEQVKNSVLKPINDYVYNLYPAPKFLKYEDGFAYLRQCTHAEIWIKRDYRLGFYFLDRPHIRQFYCSDKLFKADGTFMVPYRFYSPWFFDLDRDYEILQVNDEYTPFVIQESVVKPIDTNVSVVEPHFVNFLFKKDGEHMINPKHGKISIGTPMYDIKIKLSKEELSSLNSFYSTYKFHRF